MSRVRIVAAAVALLAVRTTCFAQVGVHVKKCPPDYEDGVLMAGSWSGGKYYTWGKIPPGDPLYGKFECGWYEDKEASKTAKEAEDKYEAHKRELIWALRTRVLTDVEMKEVEERGAWLLVPTCSGMCAVPNEAELDKRFNDLLLQQVRLRLLERKIGGCAEK